MIKRILYAMLIFVPLAIIARLANASPTLVFILAALGIIPLADLIGEATEELAVHTGPRVGGLLNATLGNAAELIITIFAIREGLLDLVRASITGSIIGNMLLILGLGIFLGGLKNGVQTFDRRQAGLNATLALLAILALSVPSLFHSAFDPNLALDLIAEFSFNEVVAFVMIVLYGLSIVFFLRTQSGPIAHEPADTIHESKWSLRTAVLILIAVTIGTAVLSEILVGAVEPVVQSLGLSELFLGIIIIPLVGNVAEHLVAVETAIKNKMELSLGIALGSSLQIALFVAPVLVFVSLIFGQQLLLVFNPFELIALFAASLVAVFVAQDGESNWLEGAMLLAIYLIVGAAFFFVPVHV